MAFSANDFLDPLLCVLAKLSKDTPGAVVSHKDTYQPVMDAMGIHDVNEYGMNAATNKPMVVKWIQWAFTNARKADLGESLGRGKWTLTAAGLAHVVNLEHRSIPTTADAVVDTTTVPTTTGVSINMNKPNDASGYHADAYIRALAIKHSSCFGAYSNHASSVCSDCPLNNACQNALAANYSRLALMLAREDVGPSAPKAKPAVKVDPAAPPQVDLSGIDFTKADEIISRTEATCAACSGIIKEKEKCLWVESVGDAIDDEGALFHLGCKG